ncbi:regulator [Bacillaceae bacterium JMAK1]|nr:regulator [Bacillaceae bacterium JMAK1]
MQSVVSTPVELLDVSEELSFMITRSDVYTTYLDTKREMNEDDYATSCIVAFNDEKVRFEEVQRFGKYHPDYHTVTKAMRLAKREMDMCETVAAFRKAERDLEKLLSSIGELLASSVSPFIKVPSSNPYFDSSSCSGGCGSGGSCSCS